MGFSRWLFWIAGAYGLIALVPYYFLERTIGAQYPPAITHPEFFYGFVGVAIAWQIAFLKIGSDPVRFRPLILPSIVEKVSFAAAVSILFAVNRVSEPILAAGLIDLLLAILFLAAWLRLRSMPIS